MNAKATIKQTYHRVLPTGVRRQLRLAARRAKMLGPHAEGRFLDFAPPGHYYSPIPRLSDALALKEVGVSEAVPGIDLKPEEQRLFFDSLTPFLKTFPTESNRYYPDPFFSIGDAALYRAILLRDRPSRVIEVGSGFSSALLLDVVESDLPDLKCTFVEPYPDRLNSLLRLADHERVEIIEDYVQNVPMDKFRELGAGDILFIDSSHVAKVGSDVNFLVQQVLPALKTGVLVHIHDILWPFEYPAAWYGAGRAWNEAYLIRAFLQFNDEFTINFFADWFCRANREYVHQATPILDAGSASLWLRRSELMPEVGSR